MRRDRAQLADPVMKAKFLEAGDAQLLALHLAGLAESVVDASTVEATLRHTGLFLNMKKSDFDDKHVAADEKEQATYSSAAEDLLQAFKSDNLLTREHGLPNLAGAGLEDEFSGFEDALARKVQLHSKNFKFN